MSVFFASWISGRKVRHSNGYGKDSGNCASTLLFVEPFATRYWASARGRSHWVELERWQDLMAGPLSAIADAGSCEYVYPRGDWRFATVSDPASLLARLREWHAGLAARVERFSHGQRVFFLPGFLGVRAAAAGRNALEIEGATTVSLGKQAN